MDEECAICLQPLDLEQLCETRCGHRFHSACVLRTCATTGDGRCPLCRSALFTSREEDVEEHNARQELMRQQFEAFEVRRTAIEADKPELADARHAWLRDETFMTQADAAFEETVHAAMSIAVNIPTVLEAQNTLEEAKRRVRSSKSRYARILRREMEVPQHVLNSVLERHVPARAELPRQSPLAQLRELQSADVAEPRDTEGQAHPLHTRSQPRPHTPPTPPVTSSLGLRTSRRIASRNSAARGASLSSHSAHPA